jgi:hypothetical protein
MSQQDHIYHSEHLVRDLAEGSYLVLLACVGLDGFIGVPVAKAGFS